MNLAAYLTSFKPPVTQSHSRDMSWTQTPEAKAKWKQTIREKRDKRWKVAFNNEICHSSMLAGRLGIDDVSSVNQMLKVLSGQGLVERVGYESISVKGRKRYFWKWIGE